MSHPVRLTIAAVGALLAVLAIGVLTRVPYTLGDRELAAVRLSWRMAGHAVEECRTLSAEAIEKLPAHMRQPEVCESYVSPYRLRVLVDGETIEDVLVMAGGSRQDNPIYVYSELRLAPGPHELSLAFWQEESGADALPSAPAAESPDPAPQRSPRPSREPAPSRLELLEKIELRPGQVALVTYDQEARALVLR